MQITLIAISKATLLKAQERILGCEACSPEVEIPFDWVLDDVTGYDGSEVDYVLSEPLIVVHGAHHRSRKRHWWSGSRKASTSPDD